MRRLIPAGLIDSGFAALATFAVTIYAARTLTPEVFGYFALFWAAFLMAAIVPAQMWFQPWEVESTQLPSGERIGFLLGAMRLGSAIALVSGVISAGISVLMSGGADTRILTPFAVSLVVSAIVSPLQDFIRRALHVGNHSARAAMVSALQFAGAGIALFVLDRAEVNRLWIPFLALTFANVVSGGAGLAMAPAIAPRRRAPLHWSRVLQSGSWLLVLGVIVPLVGLLVNWIVLALAGPVLLGLAEAARIVGRPVLVVTNGLGLALRPRSFETAIARDEAAARRVRRAFLLVTIGGGLAYTALVSIPWAGNPMSELVPSGFSIPVLVPAICLANVLVGISFPVRYELIAMRRERYITGVEFVGQLFKTSAAGAALWLGAFVIPLGEALLGIARYLGYTPVARAAYPDNSEVLIRTTSDPENQL